MADRPRLNEDVQLLVAADVLERFLWVGYGPDVAEAVNALQGSALIPADLLAHYPVVLPRPRAGRERDEAGETRTLAALTSQAIQFVDRVAGDPDAIFRAAFSNIYSFARDNLSAQQGWFANNEFTGARLSALGRIALRWTVEDEATGDVSVRFLARALVLNCESVVGVLRALPTSWRRLAHTSRAAWAEGTVGSRDVRFFAGADGTGELTIRGESVENALVSMDEVTTALDQVAVPIQSIGATLSGILQRY